MLPHTHLLKISEEDLSLALLATAQRTQRPADVSTH